MGSSSLHGQGKVVGHGVGSRAQLLKVNPTNRSFLVVMAKAEVTHGWVRGMRWMPPPTTAQNEGTSPSGQGQHQEKTPAVRALCVSLG